MDSLMSTNPERAVSYVLSKYVTEYMDKDVLILSKNTPTREAARMLQHYETDDIIVTDGKKRIDFAILRMDHFLCLCIPCVWSRKVQGPSSYYDDQTEEVLRNVPYTARNPFLMRFIFR